MKIIAGAIIASISLFTEMMNEWLHHFFYAMMNIAKGTLALSSGYTIVSPYNTPEQVDIFLIARIIIWVFVALGILLIIWGLWERTPRLQNH